MKAKIIHINDKKTTFDKLKDGDWFIIPSTFVLYACCFTDWSNVIRFGENGSISTGVMNPEEKVIPVEVEIKVSF